MTMPYHLPPDACFDHPVDKIEPVASTEDSAHVTLGEALNHGLDWIMHGDQRQRSLRFHLVVLHHFPDFLPCKRPSAAWCGYIHGVSRQRASDLKLDYADKVGPYIRLRSYRSRSTALCRRRGRVRQGTEGPQPGPVAGV
jgi:hypothetical protein